MISSKCLYSHFLPFNYIRFIALTNRESDLELEIHIEFKVNFSFKTSP